MDCWDWTAVLDGNDKTLGITHQGLDFRVWTVAGCVVGFNQWTVGNEQLGSNIRDWTVGSVAWTTGMRQQASESTNQTVGIVKQGY